MLKNFPFLLSMLVLALFLSSCNDDDPIIENEEELITTLGYTLMAVNGETVTLLFQDFDGDGGNPPIITGGTLEANSTYLGSLQLLNESETPTEDITEEIAEEDEDHQFFFETDIQGLSFVYTDGDSAAQPVGLRSTLSTGDAGSGTITITLRHEPNKSADGVSDGDITNAGGETDIEVTFPVDVE